MKSILPLLLMFIAVAGFPQLTAADYKVKSLDANSENSDFGTTFYGEDKIVFSSARMNGISNKKWDGNNQPFLDLYVGTIAEDGEITRVRPFSSTVNSKYHDAMVDFSPYMKYVYFTSNNYLDGILRSSGIKIFRATIGDNGQWKDIITLPFNSDNYDTGHPSVSDDGKKLYFTSNMPGGYGDTDIYVVSINNGHYGAPKNLGPKVNSKFKEYTPFVDGDILYYSSNRPGGHGRLDIYMTKLDESLEEPINLGKPMNSNMDDLSFIINKQTQKGYFSSNRGGGKGDDDIYSFEELTVNPICDQVIRGVIRDKTTGQAIPNAFATLYDGKGNKIKRQETLRDGVYYFKVKCGTEYKVMAEKFGYFEADQLITTSKENAYQNDLNFMLEEKEFVRVDGREMLNVRSIEFDLNQANIKESSYESLNKVVRLMEKFPDMIIQFGAHTDSRGGDGYNMWLSQKRAAATVSHLISIGADPRRITGKGFGETKLVNKCSNGVKCTEVEHQQNRRTEFIVIRK